MSDELKKSRIPRPRNKLKNLTCYIKDGQTVKNIIFTIAACPTATNTYEPSVDRVLL